MTNPVFPDRHPKDAREALDVLLLQSEISCSIATRFEYTFLAYLLTLVQKELTNLVNNAESD